MPEDAGFEWFGPVTGVPMVSVAEYGLTFNRAAIERLGSPDYVMIGFDRKRKVLGVRAAEPETNNASNEAFRFALRARNGYVRIASKDLVRYVSANCPELSLEKTVRFAATWDGSGMLTVDLRRPVGGRSGGQA